MSLPIDVEPGMRGAQGPGPNVGTIKREKPKIIGIIGGKPVYQIDGACEITRIQEKRSPSGEIISSTVKIVYCGKAECPTNRLGKVENQDELPEQPPARTLMDYLNRVT